jgi:hypothetical protein
MHSPDGSEHAILIEHDDSNDSLFDHHVAQTTVNGYFICEHEEIVCLSASAPTTSLV